jgi:hypothetical protein
MQPRLWKHIPQLKSGDREVVVVVVVGVPIFRRSWGQELMTALSIVIIGGVSTAHTKSGRPARSQDYCRSERLV